MAWLPIFREKRSFEIIVESLKYCQDNKGHLVSGYVIMLTHFHLMALTKEGVRFQDVMRDMKKFMSKEISSQLERDGESLSLYVFKKASEQEKGKRKYKVWQDEYHSKIIHTDTVCRQKMQYMHDNPVRKGLVEKSECWLYSSARNYVRNDDAVLSIERLEML